MLKIGAIFNVIFKYISLFFTTQYIHIIVFNMLISRPYSLCYYDSSIKTARTEMEAAPSFCLFSPIESLLVAKVQRLASGPGSIVVAGTIGWLRDH